MFFALLAAASTLQLSTPPSFAHSPPITLSTPNIYREPAGCEDIHRQVVERQGEQLKKLGRLPNGVAQYAVERRVGGCSVPTPVGYHPDYLLPGAADPPARREDGPSNKR